MKSYIVRSLLFGSLLMTIGGIGTFFIWQHQPARGTVSIVPQSGTDVKAAADSLEDYSSGLFTTKIVSNLHLKNRNEQPTASIVGQYLFTDKNPYYTDQLAITIGVTKSGVVSDISPVQFRRSRPDVYNEEPVEAGYPKGSVVFRNKDGFEKAVFWTVDENYAGIVVSGGVDKKAELENALKIAVTYWQWH